MTYTPGPVQQFTKISPAPKITHSQISELVYNLVNDLPDFVGMDLIQRDVNRVMKNCGAKFNEFSDLDVNEHEAEYINKFDSVEEMFFDRINSRKITLVGVNHLVNLCIKLCS